MERREQIIQDYIDAYNSFNIDKMIAAMDEAIVFMNISNGTTNMALYGLSSFKEQAAKAKDIFAERKQTIIWFKHSDDETEVSIDYYGLLAINLPNGLKKWDELKLQGRSIFKFSGDTIVALTDIS
jgi:hypothetical protein